MHRLYQDFRIGREGLRSMRSYVPAYDLIAAKSLEHALSVIGDEWKPFAGGTDLMVLFEAGKLAHTKFISIWGLPELHGIAVSPDHVTLGALTTYTDVQQHSVLLAEFPLLARAASETGGIATQNRGTIGGNIVNASPAADTPPALLVYDAELELVSKSGSRWVAYATFHTGYKQMDLQSDELLARIRLPRRRENWTHYYRKVGTRRAQAISKVCFAGVMRREGGRIADVRIALGSVAPTVLRCYQTEEAMKQEPSAADATLAREIAPIDDIRSSAVYRLRVAQNLLAEFQSLLS
jgi:CO/xanthine dehydrogenase FAD-binding subunit